MNANLRNCSQCGKLYIYSGRNLCPECLRQEEEEYKTVRKYVREQRDATISQVSKDTGIDEEKILQFLRDGRIQSNRFQNALECQRCGKSINEGRYCENCKALIDANLKGTIAQREKETKDKAKDIKTRREKMHVRDRQKN